MYAAVEARARPCEGSVEDGGETSGGRVEYAGAPGCATECIVGTPPTLLYAVYDPRARDFSLRVWLDRHAGAQSRTLSTSGTPGRQHGGLESELGTEADRAPRL